jgi:hypothetical protein
MNITFTLSATDLSTTDKALIKECLGLSTDQELEQAMQKLAKASLMEYVKMFRDKGLPTRADEVQQERLFFLLMHYFGNRLPDETIVSSIFQLTSSQSKTLLRNTKSRYRTRLVTRLKTTLLSIIQTATQQTPPDGVYEFICLSSSNIEELNTIISQKGPTLEPVRKVRDSASKYCCAADTYNLLIQQLI